MRVRKFELITACTVSHTVVGCEREQEGSMEAWRRGRYHLIHQLDSILARCIGDEENRPCLLQFKGYDWLPTVLLSPCRKYSQSGRKAVVYGTVLHPILLLCSACMSYWLCWPLYFCMEWYKVVMEYYPTCHLYFFVYTPPGAITKSMKLAYSAYVTAFSQMGVFSGFFHHEIGQCWSTWACISKEKMAASGCFSF